MTGFFGSWRLGAVVKTLFVLAVALGFCVLCIFLPRVRGWILPQPATFPLELTFSNVAGLKPGAPVRLAGLTVGEVRTIDFASGPDGRPFLLVSSMVEERARSYVKEDAAFTIAGQGLLGDACVNIAFGKPEARPVRPGARVRGKDPVRIEETLTKLDRAVGDLQKGGALVARAFYAVAAVGKMADTALDSLRNLTKLAPWADREEKKPPKGGKAAPSR